MRLLTVLKCLVALGGAISLSGCKPVVQDDLIHKFVNEGSAYRQHLELFGDGRAVHTVFQASGSSVSTRDAHWTFEETGGRGAVVIVDFKSVATFKDFAVHRGGGGKFEKMELEAKRGLLGTYRLTVEAVTPVIFVSVD